MPVNHEIEEELSFTANLNGLVSTYEEIAVMRIERVRNNVLAARQFRSGLTQVFSQVRTSQQQEIIAVLQKTKTIARQAAVLVSTNTRLAGDITSRTSRSFIKYVSQQSVDPVILGQVGKEHFLSALPDRKIKFFPLPAGQPTIKELRSLISFLLPYQSVIVFFGHFENLVTQKPATAEFGEKDILKKYKPAKSRFFTLPQGETFIFEPSLEKITYFFNNQIFSVLLQLTTSESWLSLLGSRITAMEQASNNISKYLKVLRLEKLRQDRRHRNRKQRDRLAGISLWE
ncbi:MAG: FoF1 ATP synthase subunit gamma [Candidatus Andersenbacteria bacterium]|nr:FoF1 ATP synthase subunit gamma [bacterium]MDZ4225728.1 FoF1 ATP synthase subunit gamma [Candidatus Andersenbacteria bacterium]